MKDVEEFLSMVENSIKSYSTDRPDTNTAYDNGVLDGEHDILIDILDYFGKEHNFEKYNVMEDFINESKEDD